MKETIIVGKITKWFVALVLSSGMLTGCSSEVEEAWTGSDDGFLQLDFAMPATRANLDQNGAGSFTEGDRIGLYIDNGAELIYRELSYEGGQWLPKLNRRELGTGRLSLSAHFPALSGAPVADPRQCGFDVLSDQSSAAGRSASDLLVSQTVLEADTYQARMTFQHALHRLRIELTSPASGAEIAVKSYTHGVVDLLTGQTSVTQDAIGWITPAKTTDGNFEAVILPQPAAPFRDADGSLLLISLNSKTYDFKAPETQSDGSPLEVFEAGKQLTVKLTLKESTPGDQDWANRKEWVYGITPPEEGAWKRYFPTLFEFDFLPVKPEYGWYDCNKLNPENLSNGIPDGMMCWAATASNMLHWWFNQNKQYIERYGDRYKGPNPDFDFQKKNGQESDIFQCFIDSFDNEAGYADSGVNWFIHGEIPTMPHRDYPYNDGGYFKDVFPKDVRLGSNVGGLGKEVFNKTIKEALSGKKALGISIGSVRESHLISVWGAEFDENGDVSILYVADNNDRDHYSNFGIGCLQYGIVYTTTPEGASSTGYREGYIPYDQIYPINRIVTMDLGEEYWKQYFGM